MRPVCVKSRRKRNRTPCTMKAQASYGWQGCTYGLHRARGKVISKKIEDMIAELRSAFSFATYWCRPVASGVSHRTIEETVRIDRGGRLDWRRCFKSQCVVSPLEAVIEANIELYGMPILLCDLRNLRVVEKSYGCRLESPRGPSGHGDAATALAMALHVRHDFRVLYSGDEEW